MNPTNQTTPKSAFTADMKIGDVIEKSPNVRWVLRQFHIGGCSHCGFDMSDTVQKVADDNGVPVDRMLTAINSV